MAVRGRLTQFNGWFWQACTGISPWTNIERDQQQQQNSGFCFTVNGARVANCKWFDCGQNETVASNFSISKRNGMLTIDLFIFFGFLGISIPNYFLGISHSNSHHFSTSLFHRLKGKEHNLYVLVSKMLYFASQISRVSACYGDPSSRPKSFSYGDEQAGCNGCNDEELLVPRMPQLMCGWFFSAPKRWKLATYELSSELLVRYKRRSTCGNCDASLHNMIWIWLDLGTW